ncbi:MAG: adenosylmethionine--8-amino-7-oxononanoate transaminase [Ekhidna sp.]|nr:adenosylmethionine--8-amino-7-oxononanoate transaminase [Ekhidna sp.]
MQPTFNFSAEDLAFDKYNVWHPYTSLTNPLPTYPVIATSGVKLKLADGRELIDGMSSWWTAIHGYNVPEINQAVRDQMEKMSHVMFGGITHRSAIDLCKKLVEIAPEGLEKVFLADSGSVSIEVAMKMAVQYRHAKGQPKRNKFMTIRGGYHGDTSGAMSVCDPHRGMHCLFSDFLPQHFFTARPQRRFEEGCPDEDFAELEQFFKVNANKCTAFILEPIMQGAGGMWLYSPDYLSKIRDLCDDYDLLLIADEIATAFGRTGKLFACEHAGISPDILCVGKALTGGYLTQAATLTTQHVAKTICSGEAGVFMHGPTYMGNPLACAAANKNLELLLNSNWQGRVAGIERQLKQELPPLADAHSVRDVRVLGAIGVLEMKKTVNVPDAQKFFVENGVWIRPFRNLIYMMPPYVIKENELGKLTKAIANYLHH